MQELNAENRKLQPGNKIKNAMTAILNRMENQGKDGMWKTVVKTIGTSLPQDLAMTVVQNLRSELNLGIKV